MKKISVILGAALCLLAVSCGKPSEAGENEVLWYDAPAGVWLEALPLGNSNMGAMVYGGVQKEEIQLNEETFWSGGPHNNNSPRSLARLDEVRQLIFDGKEAEAKTIIDQDFVVGPHGMRFLNAGSLFIEYEGVGEAELLRQAREAARDYTYEALPSTRVRVPWALLLFTLAAVLGTLKLLGMI